MIELEAQATGQQSEAELVEADALAGRFGDELGVETRGHPDEDTSVCGHVANDSAYAIDNGASAGNIIDMSSTTQTRRQLGKLTIVAEQRIGERGRTFVDVHVLYGTERVAVGNGGANGFFGSASAWPAEMRRAVSDAAVAVADALSQEGER